MVITRTAGPETVPRSWGLSGETGGLRKCICRWPEKDVFGAWGAWDLRHQGCGRSLPHDIVRLKSIALSAKYLTRQSRLLQTSCQSQVWSSLLLRASRSSELPKISSQTLLHQLASTQDVSGPFWHFSRLSDGGWDPYDLHDDNAVPCVASSHARPLRPAACL